MFGFEVLDRIEVKLNPESVTKTEEAKENIFCLLSSDMIDSVSGVIFDGNQPNKVNHIGDGDECYM